MLGILDGFSSVWVLMSPHFCKWLRIWNRNKWILVVDIPTQILLTITVIHWSRGVTRPLAKGGQGNEDFSLACERSERGSRGGAPGGGPGGRAPWRGSRGRSPRKLTGFSFIFTPRSWLVVHIIWNLITTTITTSQAMILMILSFINNYHFKCKTNEKL